MFTKQDIGLASTARLNARLNHLEELEEMGRGDEIDSVELFEIEKELDARWYADTTPPFSICPEGR